MTGTSQCRYMRRHVARWITLFVYPQGHPNAADWGLCLHSMGSAPPKGAAVLKIASYATAQVYRKACCKAPGHGLLYLAVLHCFCWCVHFCMLLICSV